MSRESEAIAKWIEEHRKGCLSTCYYCPSNKTCEYAWDGYNVFHTEEEAKHETCLAMK